MARVKQEIKLIYWLFSLFQLSSHSAGRRVRLPGQGIQMVSHLGISIGLIKEEVFDHNSGINFLISP